ncbi:MAG: hypothetical protein JXR96_05715 [Deltaproteobacteria bacterium]|nr:hypothetical protein [Deltaproteobacteria bacterium]
MDIKEPQRTTRRWAWELSALAVSLLGACLRCLPWRFVFSDSGVILPGVDPYYHLWRASRLLEQLPSIPTFDPYLSYPAAASIPWPPGFDLLLALPSLVAGQEQISLVWAALLMPLLGGLSVYLTYRLGSQVFDRPTGLVAAVLMACMHGAISFSFLGRADHHGLVAPVSLLLFSAFLASLDADSIRRTWLWGVVCGLLAAASVGSWIVTPPLYFIPIPAVLLWSSLRGHGAAIRQATFAVLIPAASLVVLVVAATGDLQGNPWSLFGNSWFVVLPYGLSLIVCGLGVWRPMTALGLAVAITLVGMCLPADGLLGQAFRVALGDEKVFSLIGESESLFLYTGWFTLRRPASLYSYLILLMPFILVIMTWRAHRQSRIEPVTGLMWAVVFGWLSFTLLSIQQRFGEFAAPALALVFGWSMVAGLRFFWKRLSDGPARSKGLMVVLVLALLAALSPLATSLLELAPVDPVSYQRSLLKFGEELSRNTPEPCEVEGRPDYGVVSGWKDSNPLLWSARRPVATTVFTTPEGLAGNRAVFRILLSEDEEASYRSMSSSKLSYIIVSPIEDDINSMADIAGLNTAFVRVEDRLISGRRMRIVKPLSPFHRCVHTRALLFDGSRSTVDGVPVSALRRFRLHLESREHIEYFGSAISQFKAFEIVKGALLVGRALPGQQVRLRLGIETNIGRRFTYETETRTEGDGEFRLRIPYSTGPTSRPCRSIGLVRLKIGDRVRKLAVGEEAVIKGLSIPVF